MLKRDRTKVREIPDVGIVEDEQIQDVLRKFRDVLIEQEGQGRDASQGYVRIQDLVDAKVIQIIDGKIIKYQGY
ncbi:MAG: hypothetical protein DRP64_19880 [Verrucomicrobia bacterium]|nr:MAG: hypothetical protein DRP64_19880 [Verrucomicrobiota bacterium]